MKKTLLISLLFTSSLAFSQVTLDQIDDFEDFTNENWTKNNTIPNVNVYDGGPLGTGDNFLRVESSGSGTNLQLLTINNAQWIGNYYQNNGPNRIKYIYMDVRNTGSNVIFLRMSFRYTSSSLTETWSAINAVAVLPGEPWKKISFYLDPSAFVRVGGLNAFWTTFNDVKEARILHNDAPSWDSDPIIATLDIDNIMSGNQPLSTENFKVDKILKIFPNPANDIIIVNSDNSLLDNFEYSIIDLVGRVIKNGISKLNQEINIGDLNSGNYIIQIKSKNGEILSDKLIKN